MNKRKRAVLSKDDAAVISAMMTVKLKPGQMLLLGPISISIITGKLAMEDSPGYIDKLVIEKSEWNK